MRRHNGGKREGASQDHNGAIAASRQLSRASEAPAGRRRPSSRRRVVALSSMRLVLPAREFAVNLAFGGDAWWCVLDGGVSVRRGRTAPQPVAFPVVSHPTHHDTQRSSAAPTGAVRWPIADAAASGGDHSLGKVTLVRAERRVDLRPRHSRAHTQAATSQSPRAPHESPTRHRHESRAAGGLPSTARPDTTQLSSEREEKSRETKEAFAPAGRS